MAASASGTSIVAFGGQQTRRTPLGMSSISGRQDWVEAGRSPSMPFGSYVEITCSLETYLIAELGKPDKQGGPLEAKMLSLAGRRRGNTHQAGIWGYPPGKPAAGLHQFYGLPTPPNRSRPSISCRLVRQNNHRVHCEWRGPQPESSRFASSLESDRFSEHQGRRPQSFRIRLYFRQGGSRGPFDSPPHRCRAAKSARFSYRRM